MSDKHHRARITKRADFAPDLWMIRIDPGAAFPFLPGQYATLGVDGVDAEGRRLERPYSIVSSPHENWCRTERPRRRSISCKWGMKS